MVAPTFADYVALLFTLFERFWQHHSARPHRGHPFIYAHKALIVFFLVMQQCRTFRFKAPRRWLEQHRERRTVFRLDDVPDRSTLSRRYKALSNVLQDFIAFLGTYAEDLDPRFTSEDSTRTKVCSKPKARCGISPFARPDVFPTSSAISIPTAHGAKVATMAGCMATDCPL